MQPRPTQKTRKRKKITNTKMLSEIVQMIPSKDFEPEMITEYCARTATATAANEIFSLKKRLSRSPARGEDAIERNKIYSSRNSLRVSAAEIMLRMLQTRCYGYGTVETFCCETLSAIGRIFHYTAIVAIRRRNESNTTTTTTTTTQAI